MPRLIDLNPQPREVFVRMDGPNDVCVVSRNGEYAYLVCSSGGNLTTGIQAVNGDWQRVYPATPELDEKERRVYYQDIVYSVCNIIDPLFETPTVCGTVDGPSAEVVDRLREVVERKTPELGEPVADWRTLEPGTKVIVERKDGRRFNGFKSEGNLLWGDTNFSAGFGDMGSKRAADSIAAIYLDPTPDFPPAPKEKTPQEKVLEILEGARFCQRTLSIEIAAKIVAALKGGEG